MTWLPSYIYLFNTRKSKLISSPLLLRYELLHILHFITFLLVSFKLYLYCIYSCTRLSPQNSLSPLRKLHEFISILLFSLMILTFVLGLVILLLIFLLKQALYIIVYLHFYLLILHYTIPRFLIFITTLIIFITIFSIILLLM